jgi:hypothetical protein
MKMSVFPIVASALAFTVSAQTADPPAAPPQAPPAEAAPAPPKERTIYVPYEDLTKALGDKSQGIFLPYAEFLEMWNQLNLQRRKEAEKPPADAVISTAAYTGRVEGDVVVTEAVLSVESFKDTGYAVLPLAPQGLAIARAEPGGAILRLGEKGHEVILTKKGPAELKFTFMTKLTRNAGRTGVALVLPRAPVTRYSLTLQESGWNFEVAPGGAFTAQPSADGKQTVLEFFNGGEAETVNVFWQKQGAGPALTPLLFAESAQTVRVAPGAAQTSLTIDWRILRAGVDRFVFTVPQPHQVLSVSGENIREWAPGEVKDGLQEVTVQLHAPARDSAKLAVELEAPLNELPAELKVPQVILRDVLRQRGTVTVSAASELDVALKDSAGLSQQAVAAPADDKAAVSELAGHFRYLQTPWSLTIAAKRADPVVEAASAVRVAVDPDAVTFLARFDIEVKRAGIFDLRVKLPAGWTGVEAAGDSVESSRTVTENGSEFVEVRLKSRTQGKFFANVNGRRLRQSATEDVTLPVFSVPGAMRHESITGVFLHESLDANSKDAGSLKPEDAQKIAEQLPPPPGEKPGGVPVLAFRHREADAKPAVLALTQKPPQVTGDVLTLVQLREQTVRYQWWINYVVTYAPVDGFVISLPQEVKDSLRVEGSSVKETNKDYKPTPVESAAPPAGRVFWRIAPRDRKTGPVTVELTLEVPAPAFEAGKPADVKMPELMLHGVSQETGQTAVVKDAALEVQNESSTGMESIDPRELRAPLASAAGVILAWKQLRHPLSLTLSVTRNVWLEVPQSIITWMVLRTAVAHDGAATTEAVYWVKNNGQQLLTVALPAGGRILSDVQAGDVPQQPQRRAGSQDLLIRLPATTGNDAGREVPVRFVYEVRAENPEAMGMSGSMLLQPALVLNSTVLQTHQTLWLPADFRYLDFSGPMSVQRPPESWSSLRERLRSLIPALGPDSEPVTAGRGADPPDAPEAKSGFTFHVPSDGQKHVLRRLDAAAPVTISWRSRRFDNTLHAGGLFVAFLAGLTMLRRSLEAKCVWFAVFGLAPLILMRLVPPGTAAPLQSVFLGTVLVSGVWLLAGLRGRRQKTKPAPPAREDRTDRTDRSDPTDQTEPASPAAAVSPEPQPPAA